MITNIPPKDENGHCSCDCPYHHYIPPSFDDKYYEESWHYCLLNQNSEETESDEYWLIPGPDCPVGRE